jgi:hypothetical protein
MNTTAAATIANLEAALVAARSAVRVASAAYEAAIAVPGADFYAARSAHRVALDALFGAVVAHDQALNADLYAARVSL